MRFVYFGTLFAFSIVENSIAMKQIIVTTALSFGLLASVVAQEKVWTMNDCMRYGVENSPAVKKQIYTHDTYKAERNASVASFFPTVSTRIEGQFSYGRSISPGTNTYIGNTSTFNNYYGLSTQIPIFTGGQLINQWLQAKSNIKMGKNDIQKAKDDLALEIMSAYADVVYYKGTIKMASDKLEESNHTLYKVKRQEELGLKGKADIAQFEAQVAADDYLLTHQQNLYNTAVMTLREKMNLPTDLGLEVDTMLQAYSFNPISENIDDLFNYAQINNPTAIQADFKVESSKYDYRIYKGQLLPQIYFNAGVSTNYFEDLKVKTNGVNFGSQFKNNLGEYWGFTVSFPLFNGLRGVTNVRRSRNNFRIAQETKTEVMRQLQSAIEQSVLDREGYAKEVVQMERKMKSDEFAYHVTLRKYEEGLMSSLDVQTSSNTLLTSKADLLQRKLMYILKSKLVDYYKGQPLISADNE